MSCSAGLSIHTQHRRPDAVDAPWHTQGCRPAGRTAQPALRQNAGPRLSSPGLTAPPRRLLPAAGGRTRKGALRVQSRLPSSGTSVPEHRMSENTTSAISCRDGERVAARRSPEEAGPGTRGCRLFCWSRLAAASPSITRADSELEAPGRWFPGPFYSATLFPFLGPSPSPHTRYMSAAVIKGVLFLVLFWEVFMLPF